MEVVLCQGIKEAKGVAEINALTKICLTEMKSTVKCIYGIVNTFLAANTHLYVSVHTIFQ